nr:LINE-type retrotransposon LIb DNA [Ipomoea batatas]
MQVEEIQTPSPIAKHGAWMIVNRKSKGTERGSVKPTEKKRGEANHNMNYASNGTKNARKNTRLRDTVGGGHTVRNSAAQVPTSTKHAGKGNQVNTVPVSNTFSYLQELDNLQETPVLLEEETAPRGASKQKNHRKTNKGKKQSTEMQGTNSTLTGLFSKESSASDHLFVFGNFTGTPPNPSTGGNWASSSKGNSRMANQTAPKGGGNNSPLLRTVNWSRCAKFVDGYNACGLLDAGTMGVRYSWYRHEGGRTILRKKLDRVFWNLDAQNSFPEAKSAILPRTHSDHHPIKFIGVAGRPPRKENRPFRFEGAWLRREDYKTLWNNVWNDPNRDLLSTIAEVTSQSKEWNKNVFGNIFKRKANLQARIKGVQESVYYPNSNGLQVLENKLIAELDQVLVEEELLWFQKSRRQWVQDGDRNTAFYHKSTLIRRNRARIRMLKINGELQHMTSLTFPMRVLSLLMDFLPSEEVDKIRAIPIPLDEHVPDALYWPNAPGGGFSVREAYRYMAGGESTDEADWVWKLKISERCRIFFWLTVKGCEPYLPTLRCGAGLLEVIADSELVLSWGSTNLLAMAPTELFFDRHH